VVSGPSQALFIKLSAGNDIVTDRIGFRSIETRGPDILLNGKPIFCAAFLYTKSHRAVDAPMGQTTHARSSHGQKS
jgi:beta-glucuronidase